MCLCYSVWPLQKSRVLSSFERSCSTSPSIHRLHLHRSSPSKPLFRPIKYLSLEQFRSLERPVVFEKSPFEPPCGWMKLFKFEYLEFDERSQKMFRIGIRGFFYCSKFSFLSRRTWVEPPRQDVELIYREAGSSSSRGWSWAEADDTSNSVFQN